MIYDGEGDIIFSLISGKATIVGARHQGYLFTQNYVKIITDEKIDSKYLVYILNEDKFIAKPFEDVFDEVKQIVGKLSSLTTEFKQLPPSEKQKDYMLDLLREYNRGMAKLKQYDSHEVDGEKVGFNYDKPDELVEKLGMTSEQEVMLTTVLTNELKSHIAKEKKIPIYQIELRMTHVKITPEQWQ